MPLTELRELLESDDFDTCMQGVALARSLGRDAIAALLGELRVSEATSSDLFSGPFSPLAHYFDVLPRLRGTSFRDAVVLELARDVQLDGMRELAVSGYVDMRRRMPVDVSALRGTGLRSLFIMQAEQLSGVDVLAELPLLSLWISKVFAYDLSALSLPHLKHLVVEGFANRPGVRRIPRAMHSLITLRLDSEATQLNLDVCAGMPKLQVLVARTAKHTSDLTPLSVLTQLRELHLTHSQISDISTLPTSLEVLSLAYAKSLVEIAPIARLHNLRRLDLSSTAIEDYGPLLKLPHLEALHVSRTPIAKQLPRALQRITERWG